MARWYVRNYVRIVCKSGDRSTGFFFNYTPAFLPAGWFTHNLNIVEFAPGIPSVCHGMSYLISILNFDCLEFFLCFIEPFRCRRWTFECSLIFGHYYCKCLEHTINKYFTPFSNSFHQAVCPQLLFPSYFFPTQNPRRYDEIGAAEREIVNVPWG